MPTRFVTITGVMTWNEDPTEPPKPPLGIWGPTDPRPTHPIYGFDRWTGVFPGGRPPEPPLGIWGPNDPRPTHPIYGFDRWTGVFPGGRPPEPPLGFWGPNDPRPSHPIAGFDPIHGTFPDRPNPPGPQIPGMPGQLPGSDPEGSGWVFAFVPGYGWMWAYVPKNPEQTPPATEPPAASQSPA